MVARSALADTHTCDVASAEAASMRARMPGVAAAAAAAAAAHVRVRWHRPRAPVGGTGPGFGPRVVDYVRVYARGPP